MLLVMMGIGASSLCQGLFDLSDPNRSGNLFFGVVSAAASVFVYYRSLKPWTLTIDRVNRTYTARDGTPWLGRSYEGGAGDFTSVTIKKSDARELTLTYNVTLQPKWRMTPLTLGKFQSRVEAEHLRDEIVRIFGTAKADADRQNRNGEALPHLNRRV